MGPRKKAHDSGNDHGPKKGQTQMTTTTGKNALNATLTPNHTIRFTSPARSYCLFLTPGSVILFSCRSPSFHVVTPAQFYLIHEVRDELVLVILRTLSVSIVSPVFFPCPVTHCCIPRKCRGRDVSARASILCHSSDSYPTRTRRATTYCAMFIAYSGLPSLPRIRRR